MKALKILVVIAMFQLMIVSASLAAPSAQCTPSGDCGDGNMGGRYHTIKYGETLFSIGRLYGVNARLIAQVNGLANPDCIYADQVLYIPASAEPAPGMWDRPQPRPGMWGQPQPAPKQYDHGYQDYPPYGYQYPTNGTFGSYGYDYTGYYYENNYPTYNRYSYTCGYNYNCY